MLKITATRCNGIDLQPGDLFSTVGQPYWDGVVQRQSIGERAYIRTDQPAYAAPDPDLEVYRLTIEKE